MKEKEVKLFYVVHNCGDGSVGVSFHVDEKLAIEEEEKDDERWAESSIGNIKLKIIDGSIHIKRKEYNCQTKQFNTYWIKLS